MICDARAKHREQPGGIEREEPNRPAAIRTNHISSHIRLGEMRDSTQIVDLEWNQADIRRAIEGIERQARAEAAARTTAGS